jgi:hypothetical protein
MKKYEDLEGCFFYNREMERDRIVDQEGMLYIQFNSANDFELIEKYAKVILFLYSSLILFLFSRRI